MVTVEGQGRRWQGTQSIPERLGLNRLQIKPQENTAEGNFAPVLLS